MMADEEGHASSQEWDLSADWLDLNSISWVSELLTFGLSYFIPI
jgi:hypothetical protein